ncbi:hypothetical protein K435DRAFT_859023 [Dendrothele bispora CBS 962.96]|uniref:F-box domain-containing protein n=1 Tax=Dendrothele bispora (strain CBS 962.96) TaxID=1314807 RepID=A0A4S8M2N4_DENBC|nr:hypothetical protein K435DRAFT_859023 [Dendrothele bispora CBS 962.96]
MPELPAHASENTANSHDRVAPVYYHCLAESLPKELIILIISHIRSKSDLRSCSTVCRSWSFPAQSRLYSTLAVDDLYEFKTQIKQFQSLPHICRAVKRIHSDYEPESRNLAKKLFRKLPNVKEAITEYWDPRSVRILRRLKNLKSLSLFRVLDGDMAHVTLGIGKMERLKSLDISVDDISHISWTPSLLPKQALESPLKLRALGVMICTYKWPDENTAGSTRHVLDWLCSPVFDHSEVQTLSLVWKSTWSWGAVLGGVEAERLVKFFNALNPQLENLVLGVPGDTSRGPLDTNIFLDTFYGKLLFLVMYRERTILRAVR